MLLSVLVLVLVLVLILVQAELKRERFADALADGAAALWLRPRDEKAWARYSGQKTTHQKSQHINSI